jgi:hypothetical protein
MNSRYEWNLVNQLQSEVIKNFFLTVTVTVTVTCVVLHSKSSMQHLRIELLEGLGTRSEKKRAKQAKGEGRECPHMIQIQLHKDTVKTSTVAFVVDTVSSIKTDQTDREMIQERERETDRDR